MPASFAEAAPRTPRPRPVRPDKTLFAAFPHTAAMHRYTGWAAGRVCDRGARLAEWLGRLITGNGTAITGSGLGWGRFAAGHVIARSVCTLAGKADTASGRVAGQGECLSRKRWRERDDHSGFLRAVSDTSASTPYPCRCTGRRGGRGTACRAGDRGTAPRRRGLSWVTRPGMRPWDATTGSRFSSRRAGRCDAPRTSGGTRSC